MIKVVLFDFFGVFCPDLYWIWLRSQGFALEDCDGFEVPVEKLDLGLINLEQFYAEVSEKTALSRTEIKDGMQAFIRPNLRLIECARFLRENYKVGLLSNSDSGFLREIITMASMEDCFDQLLISSETGFRKPDPRAFTNAATIFQAPPVECIFIDDRPYNVEAAEALGMTGICFKSNRETFSALVEQGLIE